MNVLQRIRFSPSSPAQPLYAGNHHRGDFLQEKPDLAPRTTLSLDSFFNSFVVGPNGWPSDIGRVTCELRVQGDVVAGLVKRDSTSGREQEIGTFRETEPGVIQCAFDPSDMASCRIYARMAAGDAGGTFLGGYFSSDARAEQISLAVVFCTYQREADLLRNAQALCGDEDLMNAGVRVYVADNGRTLAPGGLPDEVVLLPGPNEGGAGGFNRGIREALGQGATHIVLMDDDVTLDPEAVFRCCAYYRMRPSGTAIAGVLLDESAPATVQEAGAWVSDAPSPFVVRVGNGGTSLADPSGLDALYATPEPEYGGFWLFAFPAELLQTTCLVAPVFFKADDVEFCLRLRRHGATLQLLPGVGVQHPGFTTDFSMVKRYYWIRNMLMVEALHGRRSGIRVALAVAGDVMREWRGQRLRFAAPLAMGAADFLKGPDMLESFDNARMIADLNALDGTLRQKEGEGWFGRIRCGSRYALRGLFASVRLAARFSCLKRRWRTWSALSPDRT